MFIRSEVKDVVLIFQKDPFLRKSCKRAFPLNVIIFNEFNSNTTIKDHHTFYHSDIFRTTFKLIKYEPPQSKA